MAEDVRVCKVCGKKYPYCRTFRDARFRWQDVACCVEHGVEYFRSVLESRGEELGPLYEAFPQFAVVAQDDAETDTEDDLDVDEDMDEEDSEDE